ncbi:MAG TPA: tetratricopeptide repeat protein [Streptosporangiaceae bacterium]|nr:tetratricopeptide repeat protein [Streptosporangiaceae bacterium]
MTSDIALAPGNLPAEPNAFVGRQRDLAELVAILERSRALTLCGPGGIGKTRLALRVTGTLAERFPDGTWIADLADADLEDEGADTPSSGPPSAVALVTAALGIRPEVNRELADTLTEALRPRTMLLILDTCEHLVEACAELVQRLLARCPGLRVIATSREPLGVRGEIIWRVPPLGLPHPRESDGAGGVRSSEAVQLFVERATAAWPGFELNDSNLAAVAEICRTLDGVPLAIELAAARVRALSAEQIADRLADKFELLALGHRTAPPRQQTLRATVEWSNELLNVPERLLLRRLSVFHGWNVDMAERVCADGQLPAFHVLDQLRALIDKSLVSLDGELNGDARYRLLDTVRELAAEQAAEADEMARLRLAHRDCMLSIGEEIASVAYVRGEPSWPERVALFHRARTDRANFNLALACCVQRGDAEEGLRLSHALSGYWLASGEVAEGAGWLDRLLTIDAAVPAGVRAKALAVRAEMAFEQLDYAAAASYARECLELSRPIKDGNPAAGLRLLALTDLMSGQADQALTHADAAVAAATEMGDDWELGVATAVRAAVIAAQGDLTEAEKAFQQALDVLQDNNGWGVANVLYGLGRVANARRDLGAAAEYFSAALALYRQIDARPEMARCLAGIGRIALTQGDLPAATDSLTESMQLSLATGQRLAVARGLQAMAALASALGDAAQAVRLAGAAQAASEAVGGQPSASASRRLARLVDAANQNLGPEITSSLLAEGKAMSPHRAAQLLTAPAPRTMPEKSEPAGPLSSREFEIATLAVGGMSNREIADRLFIAPATVARHIANIFGKLELSSRAQLAVWMAEHGPGPE